MQLEVKAKHRTTAQALQEEHEAEVQQLRQAREQDRLLSEEAVKELRDSLEEIHTSSRNRIRELQRALEAQSVCSTPCHQLKF